MAAVAAFVVGAGVDRAADEADLSRGSHCRPPVTASPWGALAGFAGQLGGIAALAGTPFGVAENRAEALGVLRPPARRSRS